MSLQTGKLDKELGLKVHKYLLEKGVETPGVCSAGVHNGTYVTVPTKDRIELITKNFREIMSKGLGLDLRDDSLMDTPKRVAKMFVEETFWGLSIENFPKITTVENKMKYDEMVIERNISVQSSCEHHFQNIDGFATIAYIPKDKVLGLSKMNRIVEYFSRRPQIQERLAEQIYYALSYILETENVAVVIEAEHFCVKARGVEDTGSDTVTSKLGGVFKEIPQVRSEFMNFLKSKK